MFDTMTITKTVGALSGALLIYLLGAWAAETLFGHPKAGYGEEVAQAYVIETGADEPAADAGAPAVDLAVLLAAGDPAAGERVFNRCASCHKLDGTDGTGPHLNGVINRPKAAIAGYAYSEAILAVADEIWSPENMYWFLENPRSYMPGNKMVFAGMPRSEDRANLVAYLATTAP